MYAIKTMYIYIYVYIYVHIYIYNALTVAVSKKLSNLLQTVSNQVCPDAKQNISRMMASIPSKSPVVNIRTTTSPKTPASSLQHISDYLSNVIAYTITLPIIPFIFLKTLATTDPEQLVIILSQNANN